MLHLIERLADKLLPRPVHRLLLRWAHAIRLVWWRWRRPTLRACRVLAMDPAGRVLLVRHSYGPSVWMPPGGGLAPQEDPVSGSMRELAEEVGCTLESGRVVAVVPDHFHGAGSGVHVVRGFTRGTPRPDGREIVEAAFFEPEALPANTASSLRLHLDSWLKA